MLHFVQHDRGESTKLGVQTRPWGPEANRTRLAGVLTDVAAAGYDGFEIGAQHLDLTQPDHLLNLAARHGLGVAAIHVGGDLASPDMLDAAWPTLQQAVAFAAAVGALYVPFSGRPAPDKTEEDYIKAATILNRVGGLCHAHGVRLCYHNHWWEIEHDCAELRALLRLTDPALVSLCLDVAWVQRSGGSPVAVTREFADRIGYFHLKDTEGDEWREVGYGVLDWDALLPLVRARHDSWAIVEQDETQRAPVESARLSREFLSDRLGLKPPG
jgi:sugar phosphate isomerase/epimerase